jgi:hypothetical protein
MSCIDKGYLLIKSGKIILGNLVEFGTPVKPYLSVEKMKD